MGRGVAHREKCNADGGNGREVSRFDDDVLGKGGGGRYVVKDEQQFEGENRWLEERSLLSECLGDRMRGC